MKWSRLLGLTVVPLAIALTSCGASGPAGPGPATTVGTGIGHAVVRFRNGAVWAWGAGFYGELGNGATTDSTTPVQVLAPNGREALGNVAAVAAGGEDSFALRDDGTVLAWGDNGYGQLGDGTVTKSDVPVHVLAPGGGHDLANVTAVAAGNGFALALRSDGSVVAWGENGDGQLGDGTTTDRHTPIVVRGPGGTGSLGGVTAVAAGGSYALAVKSDGTVWAWGANGSGQLGDGTTAERDTPVEVRGPRGSGVLSGVTAVTAANAISHAVESDGTLWGWGANTYGVLGDGTTVASPVPVRVVGPGGTGTLDHVVAVAAGDTFTLAMTDGGNLWAWGANTSGQLGDGTTATSYDPVQVVNHDGTGGLATVVAVAAGRGHGLAVTGDGAVWAWGQNNSGQLGDGTHVTRTSPSKVPFAP